MTSSATFLPEAAGAAPRRNGARDDAAMAARLSRGAIVGVALLHPVLSLLLLGAINLFGRVSRVTTYAWIAACTVLIVSRQYGVAWSEESDDDAPIYFDLIARMVGRSLDAVLFDPDLAIEMEPIPKLFWWLTQGATGSLTAILLIQCFLWLWAIWYLATTVSQRYAAVVFVLGLFLIPTLVSYELLHLYRSAWALFFIALAVAAQLRESRWAYLWAVLAVFSHVSAVIYLVAMVAGRLWADGRVGWKNLLAAGCVAVLLVAAGSDALVDNVFYAKLLGYSVADAPDRALRIAKALLVGGFLVYLFRASPRRAAHRSLLICTALVVLAALEPSLNAISDRLLTLYVPVMLIGLAPVTRPRLLAVLLLAAALRSVELLDAESVLRFSSGIFEYPIRVPVLDLTYLLLHAPQWPGV